ncbi:MAG TPA: hypothetical protein VKT49_10590 [Bryobacteraceae bacterium]|nr:hypothetical protein [Bryobacteraceae bacterium]
MKHLTQEDLILHFYAEGENLLLVEQHLEECEDCQAHYQAIERTLAGMDALTVPDRGPGYEAQVWARLQPKLAARRSSWWHPPVWRWAAAGAALAALLAAAFLAGRSSAPTARPLQLAGNVAPEQRALLTAIGTHLERSQMVLTELANASAAGPLDISFEQERAADLLGENRLYRQSATGSGDALVADVLDELERVLLEIEHAPSRISPDELDDLRLRLRAEGILFKLRVLGSNVRDQQEPIRKPL